MSETTKLSVGFARVDITPKEPVPLGGFGNTMFRIFKTIRDPLMASCFAVTDDQDTTVLLVSLDLSVIENRIADRIRGEINTRYGVPVENIILSAIHTPAGPDMHSDCEAMERFYQYLQMRVVSAAGLALADRWEAKAYMSDIETENMNFVRHYQNTDAEGNVHYFGDGFGKQVLDATTRHITDADPTMHILKFVRPGSKDLVLANFRMHPITVGAAKKYELSADVCGEFRKSAEERSDMLVTYFQGAAGNVNCTSRIPAERIAIECAAYGARLADYLFRGLQNMEEVKTAPIRTKKTVLEAPTNHSTDCLLEHAKQVQKIWMETYDIAKARECGRPYGIRSPYHANAIARRTTLPPTMQEELDAISIGNLAFVAAPNELFDPLSVYVEEHAPYDKVITLGYANGYKGYVPTQYGYEYTCYESDCTNYAPGAGELIAETLVSMLEDLKK